MQHEQAEVPNIGCRTLDNAIGTSFFTFQRESVVYRSGTWDKRVLPG